MLHLGLTVILTEVVTILFLSSTSQWCCIRVQDRAFLCQLYTSVQQLLDKHNIKSFLCYGSCLAAVRDNGTHIQHEHDVDLCILKKDETEIESILEKEYDMFVNEDDKGSLIFRIYNYKEHDLISSLQYRSAELWIDVYSWHHFTRFDKLYTSPKHIHNSTSWQAYKYNSVYPLVNATYCQTHAKVPKNHNRYLSSEYGSGYNVKKIPQKGFKGLSCHIWYDC